MRRKSNEVKEIEKIKKIANNEELNKKRNDKN